MQWFRVWVLALAALLLPASAPAPPARPHPRIVAIGDLHGDFAVWRAIARAAHVIDDRGHWAGGRTILVQTGDVPDRGPDTRRILDDLIRLQKEARAAGGRVVAMVGNHEAMNLIGDLRYVDPGEYAAFVDRNSAKVRDRAFAFDKIAILARYRRAAPRLSEAEVRAKWLANTPLGFVEHRAAWRPSGHYGRWVAGNPALVLIDGTLFVHGGLSAAYAKQSIDQLNRRVAATLNATTDPPDPIVEDPAGPLWYRGYADGSAPSGELAAVLKAVGARRMVIGHTPVLAGIAIDAQLIRIDTGNAAHYRGQPSWLEIANDVPVGHRVARPVADKGG